MPTNSAAPVRETSSLRCFMTALTQILIICALGIAIAAVSRLPSCPGKEPAHAWQR